MADSVRTWGPISAPSGAKTRVLEISKRARHVKIVAGAQPGLLIHWNDPALGVQGYHLAETNGECFVIDAEATRLWVEYPATSTSTAEPLRIKVSDCPLYPTPTPTFDTLAIATVSASSANSTVANLITTQMPLVRPTRWRSVVVMVGQVTGASPNMVLNLVDVDTGRENASLGRVVANARGGGFPALSFTPPTFNWNLEVANDAAGNHSLLGRVFYSTNPPTQ